MSDIASLAGRQHTISQLVPLLDAIRSVAEIAWRRAEQANGPIQQYNSDLHEILSLLTGSLSRDERAAISGRWEQSSPVGLLLVTAERGLCGRFSQRAVDGGLRYAEKLVEQGNSVRFLSLGARGERLLEAAGHQVIYRHGLPTLGLPPYLEIERLAIDLLDLTEAGQIKRLIAVHNAPAGKFDSRLSIQSLLPPQLPAAESNARPISIKPPGDLTVLITHVLTEALLLDLYRVIIESSVSEQLSRIYSMRLAAENADGLLGELTRNLIVARRHEETSALLEVVSGYQLATETEDTDTE